MAIHVSRLSRLLSASVLALALPAVVATADSPVGPDTSPPPPIEPRQLADKSRYTLFNPTPADLMRDLSADRPDATESPYTVDAGHLQLEFSFVEWRKGGNFEELAVLPSNIKLGLTNNADIQFVINPFLRGQSLGQTDQGHGDSQIRLKVNLWGNDGGDGFFGETSLGVMPFIQFPTGADAFSNDDDDLEGGIIVPFSFPLPAEFGMTIMAEVDFVRDGGGGYDSLFVHTAAIGREIAGPLGGYVEYIGVQPIDGDGDYQALIGGGLTYQVGENLIFDVGAEVGLTSDADDLRVFTGMTLRI